MKDIKYCISCGFADKDSSHCRLKNYPIGELEKEYCSGHTDTIPTCEWCGRFMNPTNIYSIDNEFHMICSNCAELSGHCPTCTHSAHCDFEENPIGLPKQVQQQIRQGNSVISTVVVNPERIRETCAKNCKCFSEEFGCLRQNCQTCGEWTFGLSKRGKENA